MSSFDENIAELRGIEQNTEDTANPTSLHQTSVALSSNPSDSSPRQSTESDPERQPLLNHTLAALSLSTPSQSVAPETSTHSHGDGTTDTENERQDSKRWFANMPGNLFFTLSTIYGASSVALGAFGAHGLKKRISDPARVANWSTAAQYQVCSHLSLSSSCHPRLVEYAIDRRVAFHHQRSRLHLPLLPTPINHD